MKKSIIMAALMLSLTVTACGSEAGVSSRMQGTNLVEETLNAQTAKAEDKAVDEAPKAEEINISSEEIKDSSEVDIDLSSMTSDMVYATVYNIVTNPDPFIGKTIKMKGKMAYSYSDDGKTTYANVVIADATACCAQGIEFQIGKDGEYKCPEDYPSEGEDIVVTGTLEYYLEGNNMYLRAGNSAITT